jgi:hypothetical protein
MATTVRPKFHGAGPSALSQEADEINTQNSAGEIRSSPQSSPRASGDVVASSSDAAAGGDDAKKASTVDDDRANIAKEILATERKYVEALGTMVERYRKRLLAMAAEPKSEIKADDVQRMFMNVAPIYQLNLELLKQLDARLRQWSATQKLGDVFMSMAPFFKLYVVYSNDYDDALHLYNRYLKDSARFAELIQAEKTRDGSGMTLEHLLIMPVQRIPRYNLLLRDLIKKTDAAHPDFASLSEALAATEQVAAHINESKGRLENMKKLAQQSSKGAGFRHLMQAHRHLVKEGVFRVYDGTHRSKCNCLVPDKERKQSKKGSLESVAYKMHMFLFNDLFVYAKSSQVRKHKDMSKLKSQFPLSLVWVKDRGQLNLFEIVTPTRNFVVTTDDERVKTAWIDTFQRQIDECVGADEVRRDEERRRTPADTVSNWGEPDAAAGDASSSDSDSDDDDRPEDMVSPYPRRYATFTFFEQARYRGWWRSGLMHGVGELEWAGNKYTGEWLEGDRSGVGSQTFFSGERYEGQWLENAMHGMGVLTTAFGDKYAGRFQCNQLSGRGAIHYATGDCFDGEFEAGIPHGHGKIVKVNGLVYEGQFGMGLFHGHGRLAASGGKSYDGEWNHHLRHGTGTMQWPDGRTYDGQWRAGVQHGHGTMKSEHDGTTYEGEFADGRIEGRGTLTTTSGVFVGKFVDGNARSGEMRFANGDVYTGGWRAGKFHGHGVLTCQAGPKWDGNWDAGRRQGKFAVTLPGGRFTAQCKDDVVILALKDEPGNKVFFDMPCSFAPPIASYAASFSIP